MKKTMRWLCVLCALCVLATGIALADGCGIGDAAVLSPDAAAQPANTNVLPAVQVPAGVAGVSASYATENSTKGFVYRMYKVVLGREPDEDGFNTWVTLLDSQQKRLTFLETLAAQTGAFTLSNIAGALSRNVGAHRHNA